MTDGDGTISFQDASVSATSTTVALTATNSTDANMFISFVDSATGNETIRTDTGLRYNPSSGAITATSFTSDGAQGITVRDNLISTASSNADININPHGTGKELKPRTILARSSDGNVRVQDVVRIYGEQGV